jgi:hypothetical protein
VYLLYWYKSTNTGTKVQILTQKASAAVSAMRHAEAAGVLALLVQKYEYRYKSTNTDAEGLSGGVGDAAR